MSSNKVQINNHHPKNSLNTTKAAASNVKPPPPVIKAAAATTTPPINASKALENTARAKMLQAFWKLSEFNSDTRQEGIKLICDYFGTLDAEKNKDDYAYILTRLVKGLASNRKCSRIGFSCALTELLTQFETLPFETVLQIAKKNLVHTPGSETAAENKEEVQKVNPSQKKSKKSYSDITTLNKEEIRHMQIGLAFVYLCWIQSNRLSLGLAESKSEFLSLLDLVLNELNHLRKSNETKGYIQQIYLQSLIFLIKKVDNAKVFRKRILSKIEDDLKTSWLSTENSPNSSTIKDNLHLLLVCTNAYPDVMEEKGFLLEHWSKKSNSLIAAEHYDHVYEFLSQSTESLPTLQPFCMELLDYGMTKSKKTNDFAGFNKFWMDVIDKRLSFKREVKNKCLSFKLFAYCLSKLNAESIGGVDGGSSILYESLLLSNNLLQSFVVNYTHRANNLFGFCHEIERELVEIVRVKEADLASSTLSMGADLAIAFMQFTNNCHEISDMIGSFILVLNEPSLRKLFDYLINEFVVSNLGTNRAELSDEDQVKYDSLIIKQMWLINQLSAYSKNNIVLDNHVLLQQLLAYLMTHSYFTVNSAPAKLTVGKLTLTNEKLEAHFRETLLKYIGLLISKNNPSTNQILVKVFKSIESAFVSGELQLSGEKLAKRQNEYKALWSRVVKLLSNVEKQQKKLESATVADKHDCNKDVLQTVFMITSFECLRMFDSYKDSLQVIEDLEICYQKFLDNDLNNPAASEPKKIVLSIDTDEEKEPDWIDMLVEMLLTLFTINNRWIRSSVKVLFKKLFPKLTFSSVKLIIDLLEPNSENDMLVDADDEEGEDDENDDEEEEDEGVETKDNENDQESGIEDLSLSPSSLRDDQDSNKSSKDKRKLDTKKKPVNGSKKQRKNEIGEVIEEGDESSGDEDEDEEDDSGDDSGDELKNAITAALGDAVAGESSDSDLDDEAMMKLDDAISNAFKLRVRDKRRQADLIQYKSRALDLIQELFKSTYRLDLIMSMITPMLHILFESQKKPSLKSISQRILEFLISLKHTTTKLNDSILPPVEDVFQLLNHVISCASKHFNVTNTLVGISMFCVRLINHSANTNPNEATKKAVLQKLTEIYAAMIKGFYSPTTAANEHTSKINPIMYKEYLLRYPAHSLPLSLQMIEFASAEDVKLHKKTVTLVTLYQTVNNQMFNNADKELSDSFLKKIFAFFNQIMDEIIADENVHIKFVDAFLNLVARFLNLQKHLIKPEYIESLANKMTQFTKETKVKQTYKSRCLHLIHICHQLQKTKTNPSS